MEEKFRKYKEYDFKGNQKWQMYLNNLYPMPPLKVLEKRKRKWYRDNIDKDFDINYEPEENAKQENAGNQQNAGRGPAPGANPYAQAYQQAAYEAIPKLKPIVGLLYLLFCITLPFQFITNKIALAACITGVIHKQGIPKFSVDYLRQVIPDDHFQNLGYLTIVLFLSGVNFVVYTPLVLYSYLIVSDVGIKMLQQNPNLPVIGYFKEHLQKGVNQRANFLAMKADLEIYIGIYLMVGWFLGWSSIISIFFFWQYMRIKYMINYNTQLAFRKFANTIDGYINKPSMPGLLQTGWSKIKQLCAYMVQTDQPQEGGAARSPSMCTIF